MLHPDELKYQFPIFKRQINGQPLIYLDSAATAQKPQVVIDAIVNYYSNHNANVHRGIHTLGDESTRLYAQARDTIARFLGAKARELIFVRNTTEAINLVRFAWARAHVRADDVIMVSELEHHSSLVVWQELAKEVKAKLVVVPVTKEGQIDLEYLDRSAQSLRERIKLISLVHLSNVTGALLDIKELVKFVRTHTPDARILLDAAQSTPHVPINFSQLGVDALAFSGHKLYGPMGIGGLVVKEEWLTSFSPYFVGGGMIDIVDWRHSTYAELPDKFDAGTPNVAGAVGLAAAVDWLEGIGMEHVEAHSQALVQRALSDLGNLSNLGIIGPADHRLGSIAFVYQGINGHDVAQILDSQGVAVRSGHHCTQPLHEKFGWGASVRASFGVYNSEADLEMLVRGLEKVREIIK